MKCKTNKKNLNPYSTLLLGGSIVLPLKRPWSTIDWPSTRMIEEVEDKSNSYFEVCKCSKNSLLFVLPMNYAIIVVPLTSTFCPMNVSKTFCVPILLLACCINAISLIISSIYKLVNISNVACYFA